MIAQLAPPAGVRRGGIVNGNQLMLDDWWATLGYRNPKTWWINWKDGLLILMRPFANRGSARGMAAVSFCNRARY